MSEEMKAMGVWYFECGWIVTAAAGFPIGMLAASLQKPWIVWSWVTVVILFGGAMHYAKHS